MYMALRWLLLRIRWIIPASLAVAACTDPSSATDLHPEGPPMIEQVRLMETYTAGGVPGLVRTVFGFGSHPDASDAEQHPVTTAVAAGNRLRVIMDELLRGNNLEEIQCRAVVDSDAFARVPLGDTPDDIARCAAAQDVLPSRCPGSNPRSVCICTNDGGCPSVDGSYTTPKGESVGVQDVDMDGAVDATRFIQSAAVIQCGTIPVPVDAAASYWQPSGDQQVPAQGGFDALGPAVILVPAAALPTSTECNVAFSPDVVDKDGNPVCAPPGGDITASCMPGDTTAAHFTVEPLTLRASAIANGQSRTDDVVITPNVPLDVASLVGITVTQDPATDFTDFTVIPGATQFSIHWNNGLAAMTHYTITVPVTVADAYHKGLPQPFQAAFTTAN